MTHWIIAPIVLPAIVGAAMLLGARRNLPLQRGLALFSVLALNAIAVLLLRSVTEIGPQAYFLGDWPAPFGIVLVLDRLSALMLALLSGLALPVTLYAVGSSWDKKGAHFYPLLQFLLMGIAGAFLTGDAFNLFVFFEVMLIASYGLMIHGGGAARTRAGLQYVGFNLLASALFLVALGLIYGVCGTLNLADLAESLPRLPKGDAALVRTAATMLIVVFAIKSALVPLHFWLPGTYANAPGVVAAVFAIMTKVGAYAILRFVTLVFPPDLATTGFLIPALLLPTGLATLGLGAIGVLGASTLPRLAAFASIASTGTIFAAIAHLTPAGTTAALFYALHSTLAVALMFLVSDLLGRRRAHLRLDAPAPIVGSGLIATLYLAAALALAGMPPLSGFVGKLLVLSAWSDHMLQVWPAVLVTSFLMMIGLAWAGSTLFWQPADPAIPQPDIPRDPLALAASFGLLAGIVALTMLAGPIHDWLRVAAEDLHNPWAYIEANRLGDGG